MPKQLRSRRATKPAQPATQGTKRSHKAKGTPRTERQRTRDAYEPLMPPVGNHTPEASPTMEAGKAAWQVVFLEALTETFNISEAARRARVSRSNVQTEYKVNALFRQAWDNAIAEAKERAVGELYRRAVLGWNEPVFYQGEERGTIRKYSDGLLQFFLKHNLHETYGDRVQHDHTWQTNVALLIRERKVPIEQLREQLGKMGLLTEAEELFAELGLATTTYTNANGEQGQADILDLPSLPAGDHAEPE